MKTDAAFKVALFGSFFKVPAYAGAVAIASIVLGTAMAIALVPDDPTAEVALRESATALAIALLAVPLVRLYGGTSVAWRAENILSFGLVYWLLSDLIQGLYALDVSQGVARLAFLAIGLTAVGFWTGASMKGWGVPRIVQRELRAVWSPNGIFVAAVVCFALGMLAFAIPSEFDLITMVSSLGGARFAAPWIRGQLGNVDAFWDHLQYFGYVLPTLYVVYGRERNWFSPKALLILLMAAIVVLFLAQGGGRRVVGVTLGAALLCFGLQAERVRIANVLGMVVGAGALLAVLELMLTYRAGGWAQDVETSFVHVRIDDNFLRLAQVIELFPEQVPYAHWHHLIYLAVRPIPRVLWPGKPTDPGFELQDIIGDPTASLSMSMIGECYTMLGFPAVVLGGYLFGRLAAWVNGMLDHRDPHTSSVIIPVCMMVLFAGLRGLQDLVIMSYAVLGWLLVSAVLAKTRTLRATPRLRG